jgi:peptidoglycan/LPS O-acetylase OafA/YrhL
MAATTGEPFGQSATEGAMKRGRNGRFEELDVLRGMAALCVVLSHYSAHCVRFFGEAPFGIDLDTVYGFHAVQLFFMISGFVISLTLERSNTWKDFAFSRLSRLYPAYWVAVTLMVALEFLVFGENVWVGGYIANLTMLQEFFAMGNLDNVFWTLTVELAFYVVMGVIFATGFLRRMEVLGGIWLALACLWSLAAQHLGIGLPEFLPRYLILRHVEFFVAGITFYRISTKGLTSGRVLLLLGALAAVGWIDGREVNGVAAVGWTDGLQRMSIAAVLVAIFALAVFGKLRLSVSPVTLWLGTISYSLYLCHRNLGFSTLNQLHAARIPVWITFTLTLAGALILGTLLTYVVERPALRTLRRWYGTRAVVNAT